MRHYRSWLASQGLDDSPTNLLAFEKTLTQAQRIQYQTAGNDDYLRRLRSARTEGELVQQASRSKDEASRKKLEGMIREKERQTKVRASQGALRTRDTGTWRGNPGIVARPAYGGSVIAGAGNAIIQTIFDVQRQRREAAAIRRAGVLGVGRRGGLATRVSQPTSATNRRGAAATRGAAGTVGTVVAGPTAARTRTGSTGATRTGTAQGVSGRGSGRLTTQQRTAQRGSNQLLALQRSVSAQLSAMTQRFASGARGAFRATTRSLTRSATRTSSSPLSALSPASALTSLNVTGVQSGSQVAHCKCPAPKKEKRKKDRKESCRNPVISRTVQDGIRTTKVRIQCPPSRQKLA